MYQYGSFKINNIAENIEFRVTCTICVIVAKCWYHFCKRFGTGPLVGIDGSATMTALCANLRLFVAICGSHFFFITGANSSWLIFIGRPNNTLSIKLVEGSASISSECSHCVRRESQDMEAKALRILAADLSTTTRLCMASLARPTLDSLPS
uniref:Uncharacterized protein n=1 Tax=Glossina brevipalpis TaxID=37001 RepID=A0A1A9X3C6_9MUSC